MKKILFLIICAFSISTLFAQKAQYMPSFKKAIKAEARETATNFQIPSKPEPGIMKNTATSIEMGSSSNIYTTILSSQNQLGYSGESGAVVFIHRQNTADPGGTSSGTLRYDVSLDNGATWTNNLGPLTPGFEAGELPEQGNGPRYPSCAIYNPPGNTDAANAFFVGNGPSLSGNPGSWGNIFEVSVQLDGSNLSEEYANYVPPIITLTDTFPADFHPYGVTQAGDYIYSISTSYNATGDATYEDVTNKYFSINRATFNGGTNSFNWVSAELLEDNWFILAAGDNFVNTWDIAFDPTGEIGYAVMLGGEISAMGYDTIPKPVCYKSTDNGFTWTKLPEFDFATLALFQDNLNDDGYGIRPYMTDMNIAVDGDGRLHLCVEVLSGTLGPALEPTYIQTDLTTQMIAHLHTTDGTDWAAEKLDDVVNNDAGAVGAIGLDRRPQASVSSDGEKVFLAWTKDLENVDGPIVFPDLYCVGWDRSTGWYTDIKNLTEGTDGEQLAYFASLAPYSITGGECHDYEVVFEYGEPTGTDLQVINFFYVNGAGFDEGEFTGLSENQIANAIDIYPNPASNNVNIVLNELNDVTVRITDITGKIIETATPTFSKMEVDVSNYSSGLYFFNFEVDGVSATKKVIIK